MFFQRRKGRIENKLLTKTITAVPFIASCFPESQASGRAHKTAEWNAENIQKWKHRNLEQTSATEKNRTAIEQQKPVNKSPSERKLPTAECPQCHKVLTVKSMTRHQVDKQQSGAQKFPCNLCESTFKRNSCLLDHQRRMYFEPRKLGRPTKGEVRQRNRSPFRTDALQKRHAPSLKMVTEQQTESFQKMRQETEEMLKQNDVEIQTLEKIRHEAEEDSKRANMEMKKLQTRLAILESKHAEKELPNLTDIPNVLAYFNLNANCTKADINKAVNLRMMEVSSESSISQCCVVSVAKLILCAYTTVWNSTVATLTPINKGKLNIHNTHIRSCDPFVLCSTKPVVERRGQLSEKRIEPKCIRSSVKREFKCGLCSE